jgi:hypothetical protein
MNREQGQVVAKAHVVNKPVKTVDLSKPIETSYCIPLWMRDLQVESNVKRLKYRIEGDFEKIRDEPLAVVGYGPSLNDTWEKLRDFKYIISCSGSHKFLLERGIVPTWHNEVDPRKHKIELLGTPHPDTIYLPSSTSHPEYIEHLLKHVPEDHVRMWHVFSNEDDVKRLLPQGEWAFTGGSNVALRAMVLGRFFGFINQHLFGIDGSFSEKYGKHAAAHPNQPQKHSITTYCDNEDCAYKGAEYMTTPSVAECARQVWHELDELKDVKPVFHGDPQRYLVQHMALHYKPAPKHNVFLGVKKLEIISETYRELNAQLHRENLAYGVGGGRHADTVMKLAKSLIKEDHPFVSVLDYGAGKGFLAKELAKRGIIIAEFDPAIPGKEENPRPADLVCCLDVLEHVEPDKLVVVLKELQRCVLQIGYFVIHTGAAVKQYANGQNTHLIQQGYAWWKEKLKKFFIIGMMKPVEMNGGNGKKVIELHVLVQAFPKTPKGKKSA